MLTLLMAATTPLISVWITPAKRLWEVLTIQTLLIATFSTLWISTQKTLPTMNFYLSIDEISSPLLILTCWLTAPTILASQSKLSKEPIIRQRTYIFTIIVLQITTALAFMVNNMLLFFILFESTMIPTLIIITRWGAQKERMLAGIYLLFYTLFGSMALLTALLFLHENFGSLFSQLIMISPIQPNLSTCSLAWWSACLLAFLVKMPLYGVHLWLPKAHVEAPIAGSMILAATLLKLGGYGILRVNALISGPILSTTPPLIIYAMLGVLLSAALCMRQTDIKSLIAFSSVSHMGLVIVASMIKTNWSIAGSMVLMISHGLISSALFCLANTSYERSNSRTLFMLQGGQIILPLTSAWWLMASLMNMALPPTPNFIGELAILTSLFEWSNLSIILAGLTVMLTTIYTLYLFWTSQREYPPLHMKTLSPTQSREHILMTLHIIPALILIINPEILF